MRAFSYLRRRYPQCSRAVSSVPDGREGAATESVIFVPGLPEFFGVLFVTSSDSPALASTVRVERAEPESEELHAVRALWRAHSDTLGFFPRGAFAEHAERGWVLVATAGREATIVGYLLYRVSRGRAVLVHLCSDDAWRGRGVGRALFEAFRDRTAHLLEARLTCRTDFDASNLWARFGFIKQRERPARGAGKQLAVWILDYGHPDLFSIPNDETTVAVVDANVFIDLEQQVAEPRRSLEARALRADWLQSSFRLAVTPELTAEIDRNTDAQERMRLRRLVSTYWMVKAKPAAVDAAEARVEAILGAPESVSDRSDRRQLAFAIAGDAALFLTCDRAVIEHAEELQAAFGLRVLRPVDLINDIDASEQPLAYAPERLEGSALSTRHVRTDDLDGIKRVFLHFEQQEKVSGLPTLLREMLAHPRSSTVRMVSDATGAPLGVIAVDAADARVHRIRALRVRRGGLAPTLAQHLLWRTILEAVRRGAEVVTFEDPLMDERVRIGLSVVGFVHDHSRWVKLIMRGTSTIPVARARLASLAVGGGVTPNVHAAFEAAMDRVESPSVAPGDVLHLERLLWPLKLETTALPCYIVPIQPTFAAALFDTTMAAESLFDADSELLLGLENVYYRSPRPMLQAPSRVLWYVSGKGQGYSHAKHVSAASTLTEVAVGPPSAVFKRFRRLGAYAYKDVQAIGPQAMAFTFAQTEVFPVAIPLSRVRELLRAHGGPAQHPFLSPVQVPAEAWFALYSMGIPGQA